MDRIKKALELAAHPHAQDSDANANALDYYPNYPKAKEVHVLPEKLRTNKVVSSFINSPVAESYKLLRTRVIHRMRDNKWKTIGITSPNPKVGKTLTSVNLGIAIAMEPNHSALLVDADLRRPSVHHVFGITPEYGLVDHLTSDVELDEVLLNPGIEGFDILPCPENTVGSSELLTSSKMADLVTDLKNSHPSQLILFDLPPILIADDVLAFSGHLDAILLVVEDDKTLSKDLVQAMDILEGMNLLGIVLNKSSEAIHDQYGAYYAIEGGRK